jgi:sulfotransferase
MATATMQNGIHFISGLPRAGSSLLAGILRQNTRFHAAMTSGVGSLILALIGEMSQRNEFGVFFDTERRRDILRGVIESYYRDIHPKQLVFDTNRFWCSRMPLVAELYPNAKVIGMVRDLPWVMDSIERLVRRNKFEPSRIFNFDAGGTVYSRAEALSSGAGLVGFAWNALKEAYHGEEADRLLLIKFETLTREPEKAISAVYDFIGEPRFAHDFENVEYSEPEFDARLGSPGLHDVSRRVHVVERQTILPPDLFKRYENDSFWLDPALNLRRVRVV